MLQLKIKGFHLLELLMEIGLIIYGDVYKTNYQLIFMEQIGGRIITRGRH